MRAGFRRFNIPVLGELCDWVDTRISCGRRFGSRSRCWGFLDRRFSSVCKIGDGCPPLPIRLMAELLILKHMHSLSDEVLCARRLENTSCRSTARH